MIEVKKANLGPYKSVAELPSNVSGFDISDLEPSKVFDPDSPEGKARLAEKKKQSQKSNELPSPSLMGIYEWNPKDGFIVPAEDVESLAGKFETEEEFEEFKKNIPQARPVVDRRIPITEGGDPLENDIDARYDGI